MFDNQPVHTTAVPDLFGGLEVMPDIKVRYHAAAEELQVLLGSKLLLSCHPQSKPFYLKKTHIDGEHAEYLISLAYGRAPINSYAINLPGFDPTALAQSSLWPAHTFSAEDLRQHVETTHHALERLYSPTRRTLLLHVSMPYNNLASIGGLVFGDRQDIGKVQLQDLLPQLHIDPEGFRRYCSALFGFKPRE
jgi:hypothetical protein